MVHFPRNNFFYLGHGKPPYDNNDDDDDDGPVNLSYYCFKSSWAT